MYEMQVKQGEENNFELNKLHEKHISVEGENELEGKEREGEGEQNRTICEVNQSQKSHSIQFLNSFLVLLKFSRAARKT